MPTATTRLTRPNNIVSSITADGGSAEELTGLPRGTTVGRYVLLEVVGAGGMGVVYTAYDPDLDRKIAIKLIRQGKGARGYSRARLLREAQAMAKVTHPNVVTVLDVGTIDGGVSGAAPLFVAMEYVVGSDLSAWLEAEPRDWRRVLDMFRAAGRGLAAAHRSGLVHRDFKPSNVLVGQRDRVCVADFGIAGSADERSWGQLSTVSVSDEPALTRRGAIMGTPRYMSPEQRAGAATDPRTDQFSFAVALAEAVCGEHPFRNGFDQSVDLGAGAKRLPHRMRRALLKALSIDPEQRYRSMDGLLAGLDASPRRRRLVGGAFALLAVAGLIGGLSLNRSPGAAACPAPRRR